MVDTLASNPDDATQSLLTQVCDRSKAVGELEADKVIRGALGEHVFERFVEAKIEEWDEYRMQVSDWELERYLEAF